ncbi:MAG: thiolase family protein [Gammaproteobacteria bacterium]|nr:MAG: thiolase family protein [Gammaproteobacteria bacterium]RLA18142.1 MAG: thiolase family protein [Gammaproteobacteria bacterium]
MKDIYITGVGMTPFGKQPQQTVKSLTNTAVSAALVDASLELASLGAAYFANTGQGLLEGQQMVRGQIALRAMGVQGIPVINVENACASGSSALQLACQAVAAGQTPIALAVGAEKMVIDDRERMFSLFDTAWDVSVADESYRRLQAMVEDADTDPDNVATRSLFMDIYGFLTRLHMAHFDTTQEHLAMIAAKNHTHSVHNPLSQYRQAMTVDEVMAARPISWPLTLPMCAPVSDGAAAAIVCHSDVLTEEQKQRAVPVLACEIGIGSDRQPEQFDQHLCRLIANRAYEQAGVGPADMSVAEVHDATAFAELQQTENLGFCSLGDGGALVASGATTLGGQIPVNPSGGLQSKGHPIGATGLAQIAELVTQLRGETGKRQVEGARFAIAENGGGFHGYEEAVAAITILGQPQGPF